MKMCSKCLRALPLTEFYQRYGRPAGQLRSWCKACDAAACREWKATHPGRHRAARRAQVGLPAPTRPQPELCECCGGRATGTGRHRGTLSLDHCHETGTFRGWLCGKCNTAIGSLGDTLEGVMRAVEYLKRQEQA